MPLAPTPLRRALATAVLAAAAVLAAGAAYAQIDPPALSVAWPNRADVGDTVTLVGTGLNQDATTIAAAFGSGLACPITRRTATAVDITVPPGAADGYVSVTVSGHLPDGTPTSAVSNGVPLLVIWTFFDSSGLAPVGLYHTPANEVSPGAADHLQLELQGYGSDWRGQDILSRVRHDRTSIWLYQGSGGSPHLRGGAQTAVDPLSGSVVAVASWGTSPVQALVNLSTGATLAQFPNDPNGTSLTPLAVRFDSSGVLYVGVINEQNLVSVFRFAPGDPIAFDFSGPASMVPGGVALQGQWCAGGDMAVGGDGVAYLTTCPLVGGGQTAEVLRVPGTSGALFDTFQLPDLHYADGTEWHLAANCRGAAFAAGSCWSSECNNTMTLFDLTNGGAIATLGGVGLYRGFGTDGYDDFFVHGVISVEGRWRLGLRRLTVADLPAGFYGAPPPGVTAAPVISAADLAPAPDRSMIPPEWVVKRREDSTPRLTQPRQGVAATDAPEAGEGASVSSSAPTGRSAILRAHAAAAILALPTLPPGLFCLRRSARLQVALTPDTAKPKEFQWLKPDSGGNASATILFGQAPLLEAFFADEQANLTPVRVTWAVVSGSEHVVNVDSKTLYPDQPEIVFDEGDPTLTRDYLQFQTVHLGWFKIALTPTQANLDPMTIDVNVDVPTGLAGGVPDYDQKIIYASNRYGFPPQVIKSHVNVESDGWNPYTFRYEPRTIDKDLIYGKDEQDPTWWTNPLHEYIYYRLPRAIGVLLTDDDVKPRDDHYGRIVAFNSTVVPPTWPYTCGNWTEGDDAVLMWDIVEANDGWPKCSYPWMQYNDLNGNGTCDDNDGYKGPCGRWNWFNIRPAGYLTYLRSCNRFYCTADPTAVDCTSSNPGAQWFLNGAGKTYIGQTPIASSYGLMQVLYTTAVQTMKWKEGAGRASERHPSKLFEPETSLDVGAGYDARLMRKYVFSDNNSETCGSFDQFWVDLETGIGRYRTGGRLELDYSVPIVEGAQHFMPF